MSLTIRVTDNELAAIKGYAALHGMNVSDAVRTAILERIEDELDIEIAKQAYAEWAADGKKTYTLDDIEGELRLK
ncbi:MAG: DUF6290 family protein [Acidobacteriota bacterium]|nr:DUF6290 family protein [Acidobacteriota bacterium]